MSKNAGTKIEVCGFWDTRGSIGSQQISNFRFQVRNGSGGGFLELRPIAKWEPVRLPPETRRFSGTGYQLNHSATRTTQICWAASSLSVMDQRLGTPCGKVGFETSITFEAIRYDKSYREIDRLIHK